MQRFNHILAARSHLLFIVALLALSVAYQYPKTLLYPPQSVHAWRQSDCASLALNYYKEGMNFFHPQIHLLASDGGTSGCCATSEPPLFYYTVALLYKIFGVHEFLLRGLNLLIFLTGLYYLFRLLDRLFRDPLWAATLALLFFTSPVLVYYAGNYLTNASALALGIIALVHFYSYHQERRSSSLFWSVFFYLLAGSFKITGLFMVFAILGYLLLESLGFFPLPSEREVPSSPGDPEKNKPGRKTSGKSLLTLLPFLAVLLILSAWILYAVKYNARHDSTHFSTTIFPIWELSGEGIRDIFQNIRKLWLPSYYNRFTLMVTGLLALSMIFNRRYIHPLTLRLTLLLLPVLILFILLQFWTFRDHDYYTINLFILVAMIFAASVSGLRNRFPRFMDHFAVRGILLLFLLFNILYARKEHAGRYAGWRNENVRFLAFREVGEKLPDFGVQPDDTVICLPGTSQLALYLADRKGWTAYVDARYNRDKAIYYNRDSLGIRQSMNKGARFLLLLGTEEIYQHPWLKDFTGDLAGRQGDLLVFDLKSGEHNFDPGVRRQKLIAFCDMENLSDDGRYFLSSLDSLRLDHGITQCGEEHFRGRYAAKLTEDHPFSLTTVFPEVRAGESFVLRAWVFDPRDQCRIIASGPDPEKFYYSRRKIEVEDSLGWRRISVDFFIPAGIHEKALKIYLHYPGKDSAYVDDLEIRYYRVPEP